jgi:IgGFc binding protein
LLLGAAVAALSSSCARSRQYLGAQADVPVGGAPPSSAGAPPDVDEPCLRSCTADGRAVVSCEVQEPCGDTEQCEEGQCVDACASAEAQRANVGCEYYAVNTDILLELAGSCFVSFVTNTFATPAHLTLSFGGRELDIEKFARIPAGAGAAVTYEPYDAEAGLAPGEVAILFLSNAGGVRCPVPAARATGAWVAGTGWGGAFHIRSDVPVVAMQMLPYGGGSAAITGASLLLPTSAWGENYVAVNAWQATAAAPSLDIVAMEDDTTVTILPIADVEGRVGVVEGGPANEPLTYTLNAGEFLQLSQDEELTGSPIAADKKIAVFGGSQCMYVPDAESPYCDHAEQQLPPVRAMSHEYVAANYRPRRKSEGSFLYRLVGAVPGTELTYDPPLEAAPTELDLGDAVAFWSSEPFSVKSQDAEHPFLLFAYMTGGELEGGYGDPDFVRVIAPEQYLSRYVFFTDPTYPETSLVVTRRRPRTDRDFADVELDCLGVLRGWQPVGTSGLYEATRVDLVRHDFEPQGNCDNGAQRMQSEEPFGVTVWSWGGPETTEGSCGDGNEPPPPGTFTCHVSYAYPAGESVRIVNDVSVQPVPR